MRRFLAPLLIVTPALIAFTWLHWPSEGSSGAGWWHYYNTFVPWTDGPKNGWMYRVNECGGWGAFWREAWVAFGALWLFVILAWKHTPTLWKVIFVVMWLGCFAACMVSHDKMRLWYPMAPVITVMLVYWLNAADSRNVKTKYCMGIDIDQRSIDELYPSDIHGVSDTVSLMSKLGDE